MFAYLLPASRYCRYCYTKRFPSAKRRDKKRAWRRDPTETSKRLGSERAEAEPRAETETGLLLETARCRQDSTTPPPTVRIKFGMSPFYHQHSVVIFPSHQIQSELARAETLRQDIATYNQVTAENGAERE